MADRRIDQDVLRVVFVDFEPLLGRLARLVFDVRLLPAVDGILHGQATQHLRSIG